LSMLVTMYNVEGSHQQVGYSLIDISNW